MNKRIKIIAVIVVVVVLLISSVTACSCSKSKKTKDSSSAVSSEVSSTKSRTGSSQQKSEPQKENSNTETVASQGGGATSTVVSNSDGLTYINGIWIVNKTYSMPADYNEGVDSTANKALNEMFDAALEDGIELFVMSGFRSYSLQKELYDSYVEEDGKEEADTYSARPGHSEHQTGLAFDLNYLEEEFGETAEGIWLAENCWKYGFIIRYPKGKEAVTGYVYEPWHIRYLGKTVAAEVYASGKCLEEFLNITSEYQD